MVSLVSAGESNDQPLHQIACANDRFGYELLHRLEVEEKASRGADGEPRNLFTSSFSIGSVLTMVMAGAVGETFPEIKNTLG